MQRVTTIFLVLSLYINIIHAQKSLEEQIKSSQFQMIKVTVEFLATDVKTFKNVKSNKCLCKVGYKDLDTFVKNNTLLNVDKLIGDWRNIVIKATEDKWKSEILSFKETLIDNITSGVKSHRKKLSKYNIYLDNLNLIINRIIPPTKNLQTVDKNSTQSSDLKNKPSNVVTNSNEKAKKVNSSLNSKLKNTESDLIDKSNGANIDSSDVSEKTSIDSMDKIKINANNSELNVEDNNDKENNSLTFIKFITYLIILLLVGILVFTYLHYKKIIEKLELNSNQYKHDGISQSEALKSQISKLESELKNANYQIESLQDDLKLERKTRLQIQKQEESFNQRSNQLPKEQKKLVKYARYADQGDGFSTSDLLNDADNETIFEISITSPNTANFKITDNLNAQKYALTNVAYFLSKACKYDSTPSIDSTIQTETDGELKLQGNKWLISNPVKIRFS
jgi:hypothetical protein